MEASQSELWSALAPRGVVTSKRVVRSGEMGVPFAWCSEGKISGRRRVEEMPYSLEGWVGKRGGSYL